MVKMLLSSFPALQQEPLVPSSERSSPTTCRAPHPRLRPQQSQLPRRLHLQELPSTLSSRRSTWRMLSPPSSTTYLFLLGAQTVQRKLSTTSATRRTRSSRLSRRYVRRCTPCSAPSCHRGHLHRHGGSIRRDRPLLRSTYLTPPASPQLNILTNYAAPRVSTSLTTIP